MKTTDPQDYSEKVVQKFTLLCKQGKIMYPDEVKILTYLANKYQPVTISEYSRQTGIAYKVVKDQLRAGRLAFQIIGGITFILKALN